MIADYPAHPVHLSKLLGQPNHPACLRTRSGNSPVSHIIEKFEDYADVGFAVVLLTPDDQGGLAEAATDQLQPRARQNVIFELGYFIGRLSRARVCPLYVAGVEIPSDYSGVVFVPLDDAGMWRMQLAKELKAAGFDVDMNRAL